MAIETPLSVSGRYITDATGNRVKLAGVNCAGAHQDAMWWNGNWPAAKFTDTWLTVAAAFAANPLVIGYDIKNEPGQATIGGTVYHPSWGDGNRDTDFCRMYGQVADAIQVVDPRALVFCEGLSYAADLTGCAAKLVNPRPGRHRGVLDARLLLVPLVRPVRGGLHHGHGRADVIVTGAGAAARWLSGEAVLVTIGPG